MAEQFLQCGGDSSDLAGFGAGLQAEQEFCEPFRDPVTEQFRTTVSRGYWNVRDRMAQDSAQQLRDLGEGVCIGAAWRMAAHAGDGHVEGGEPAVAVEK